MQCSGNCGGAIGGDSAAAHVPYLEAETVTAGGGGGRPDELGEVRFGGDNGGSAERAGEVRLKPGVDAFGVEGVAAEWEEAEEVVVVELREADGAVGGGGGGAAGDGGEGEHREGVDDEGGGG